MTQLSFPATRMKQCRWCRHWKPVSEFGRQRRSPDGRQHMCKDCLARNWRKNHNVDPAPPVRRRGLYDLFDEKLDLIENAAVRGGDVIAAIDQVRADLKL